jgi:putative oxidoreductase
MEMTPAAPASPHMSSLPHPAAAYGRFETRLLGLDWLKGISLLAIRLFLAQFFFFSGLTKIKSWSTTIALFQDEYHVPVLPPELAALMSATAELTLPILLVLGLFTRFAATGLFLMTTVIALFVYPGAPENYYILLLTGAIIANGSGLFGADYWLAKKA